MDLIMGFRIKFPQKYKKLFKIDRLSSRRAKFISPEVGKTKTIFYICVIKLTEPDRRIKTTLIYKTL